MKKCADQITRVCYPSNLYMILQYLLITDMDDYKKTFWFVDDYTPRSFDEHFEHLCRLNYPRISAAKKIMNYFRFAVYRVILFRKWPFLRTAEIFMCDHMDFSWLIALKRKYNLLEDGMVCYCDCTMRSAMSGLRYALTNIFYYPFPNLSWGQSPNCQRVYLTHDLPAELHRKYPSVERIELNGLWRAASEEKKRCILDCFGITSEMIHEIESCSTVLLTQAFSEFKLCTEDEKIAIYADIIRRYDLKDVMIKTHPTERTDYEKAFGGKVHVFQHKVPMELLSFIVSRVKRVVTVSSSSIAVFESPVEKVWVGTDSFPVLLKTVGHVDPPGNVR